MTVLYLGRHIIDTVRIPEYTGGLAFLLNNMDIRFSLLGLDLQISNRPSTANQPIVQAEIFLLNPVSYATSPKTWGAGFLL